MQVGYSAFLSAGFTKHQLSESSTGVFVGAAGGDWFSLEQMLPAGPFTATGSHAAVCSNRLSYVFDLKGPSMTIETACSAALVAVDVACLSLWAKSSTAALVAGVNVMVTPMVFVYTCAAHFLSPTGQCHTVLTLTCPPEDTHHTDF